MDVQKVDMFIMMNSKFFDEYRVPQIRELLLKIPEERWMAIQILQFQDPTTALLLSIFVGHLGIDRFYIGDAGLGVGKLLTCGGLGIWTLIDWFVIMNATKEKNMQKFQRALTFI